MCNRPRNRRRFKMPSRRINVYCLMWILFLGLLTTIIPVSVGAQGTLSGAAGSASSVTPGATLPMHGVYTVTGTVVSATENKLELTDPDGRTRDFALDPAASYGAAMFRGDQVRVRYDPIEGGMDLAKDIQTLDLTQRLNPPERQREAYAMSQPPTKDPLIAEVAQGDRSGTESGTASGTPLGGAPGTNGVSAELPGTATPLPFMGAAGILLLCMAIGVSLFLRRSARRA
jgi:hypothetical protein